MKITDVRTPVVAALLGLAVAVTAPTPATAKPTDRPPADRLPAAVACPADDLAGTALRQAIAGLPTPEATSAQLRLTTPAGCWQGSDGVADLRSRGPVPADARFRIGSVTKVFTAAMVLQLAAEQRVDLATPVQRYLPGLLPPDYPPVTVRQLLNHTSGLPSPTVPGDLEWWLAHRYDRWTAEQIVRLGLENPREFEPGTRQHYTNMGFIVAGLLIERVTGHSYAHELDRRIVRPLGLRGTSAPLPSPAIAGPHAHGYQAVTRDGRTELVDVTNWSQSFTPASGNLISTLADLDIFLDALLGGRVVPAGQLAEMFTVPAVEDVAGGPATYSAGLQAYRLPDGRTLWIKTGSRYGYLAAVAVSRDATFRLVYSVTSTDARGNGRPAVVQAIIGAALAAF
ncbi:MAG TPA: serine hydrolase domain-containing protein [Micromonospora sp.]